MIVYSIAKTAADRDDVFQLRFRVAYLERGMQAEEPFATGTEQDEFDGCAIHAIARHFSLMPVGTARLVLETPLGLPLHRIWSFADASPASSAELSKLAVSRLALNVSGARNSDVVTGLLRILCRESRLRGIQHWYLQLTEGMRRLLMRKGAHLTQAGIAPFPLGVSLYVVPVRQLEERLSPAHAVTVRPDLRRNIRPIAGSGQAVTC